MSCEELPYDRQCHIEPENKGELEETQKEKDVLAAACTSPGTELKLLKLSLQSERPMVKPQQESFPPEVGLQRPEPLEHMDLSMDEIVTEDMEVDSCSVSNTSFLPSKHHITGFAAGSSLQHWALTRSSSSDNMHETQLGSVHQRTQEIEMCMRLDGLTAPSRLKRSNSLAKLGGLAISSQDLPFSTDTEPGINKNTPALLHML